MPCNLMNGLSVVTFPCSFPPCYNVLIYWEVIMYLYIEKSFQCNRMYWVVFFFKLLLLKQQTCILILSVIVR